MSEIKRVNLTTVEASQKDKKVDTKKRTYRFELSLGESNAKICPEYSFAELAKNLRHSNGGDLFDESDDVNVAAIAQKFEAKYGPKAMQSGKKHRTQEMDDFYDLGDGYNEDDSFIDNTEFYDEVVPYSLTTKHGGFYINQGKLDFKSLNDDSIDEFSSPKPMKKKKKRVLDSDSGGEDAVEETGEALSKKFKAMKEQNPVLQRKKLLESKEGEKKKKKLLAGPDGEIVIKKKKKKNLEKLKLKKVSGSSSPQKVDECQTPVPATPAVPVVATPMTPVLNTPATNGSAEVINLDNDPQLKDFKHSLEETFNAILQGVKEDSSSKSGGEEVKGDQQSTDKNTQLPSQLPPDLAEAIENIKKAARESKEGKSKFFSTYVNKLLLDIELGSKNLQWGSRTSIYNHLGEHLPCGKHALLRRAKKLRESQQEVPLKIPLQRLRDAIMREMPGLVEQHEQDVAKAKLEAELKDENPETVKEEGSTESDEEEKSDNKKKPRGPRRKFQWTEEIRLD
ncbi:ubinuclein-1-like [Physella acuta]|uniref:ubinuclein-1-like n=1 Tax=Physella acuta TaxID=109671 RepID=UPI0027DBA044|nr:ubinuclein-1-like [Physella acuta]